MSSENNPATSQATSEAATPTGKTSDGTQSGNLSVGQMAAQLLQRGAANALAAQSAEQATPAAPPQETATQAPAEGQPPPASELTPASETAESESDDALSNSPSLDPKLQAQIDKRVGKEVAKRKAAEEKIARLEAQLKGAPPAEQQTPPVPAALPDSPLSNINDLPTLQKEQAQMKEVKRWAQSQLVREDLGEGVQAYGKTWSKQELQQAVLVAERVLEDQIPQRYQFIQARAQAEQQAQKFFPWMSDKTSSEYVEYQNAFRQYPWLANLPDAPMVVGVQLAGLRALQAQQAQAADATKAKATKANVTPPPASQVASGGAPGSPVREPAQTAARQKVTAEMERMKQKGNVSTRDMARLLQQKELSSR
jgi:hypothetical protein